MQDQLERLAYNGQCSLCWASSPTLPMPRAPARDTRRCIRQLGTAQAFPSLARCSLSVRIVVSRRRRVRPPATLRDREDLHYILSPSTRNLAQLLRKLIAETPNLFSAYDGNRLICDRLITCLGETWDETDALAARDANGTLARGLDARLEAALYAITGLSLPPQGTAQFIPAEHFCFSAAAEFMRSALLPPLRDVAARAALIPLEPHWAVLADLFEPSPDQWGLRGDLFLWMELRQVLCHCELFGTLDRDSECTVEDRLVAAVATLTGTNLSEQRDVYVRRYARGGMSSGTVSCAHWHVTLIPLLARRAGWLRRSWIGLG
jgi:hypothetical protein